MSCYGFENLRVLLVEIIPDETIKRAMNEVKSAVLLKEAAQYKAETEMILEVKRAEAQAEAKYLAGVGVARQRQTMIDGLTKSILSCHSNVPETARKDVLEIIMLSPYFDTMRETGAPSNLSVFIPHVPGAVHDVTERIRNEISRGTPSCSRNTEAMP